LQRGNVVQDVDAAAMCADDQIVVPGMHQNIVHPNCGQTRHELLPRFAGIDGNVKSKLRTRVQEIFVLQIFANDIDGAHRR